jgi:amidase
MFSAIMPMEARTGARVAPHDELGQVTAAELAGRIRRRESSAVEVMDGAIARIEADNERLNAFVHLDLDQARERARQADRMLASGAELGPLHGVPTAMKDLFDFKPGWPTTFGGVRDSKTSCPTSTALGPSVWSARERSSSARPTAR